jgi:hypothetical protein
MAKKRKASSRDEDILIDRFLKNFGKHGDMLKTCDDADAGYTHFIMKLLKRMRQSNLVK